MDEAPDSSDLDDRESENTPGFWLVAGIVVSIIGGVLYGAKGDTFVGYLGLMVGGLGGVATTIGAVGYGVLLALRQHRRETGRT